MAGGADIEREPSPLSNIAKILCLDRRNYANDVEDDRHDQRSHSNLLDGINDTLDHHGRRRDSTRRSRHDPYQPQALRWITVFVRPGASRAFTWNLLDPKDVRWTSAGRCQRCAQRPHSEPKRSKIPTLSHLGAADPLCTTIAKIKVPRLRALSQTIRVTS
jgi:hypothetical protein